MTERVWNALNDKPHSTSKQIATRLNVAENRAAGAMDEMKKRGMVKSRTTPLRMSNGSMRNVKEWHCVYAKYERLPLVKKPAKVDTVKVYQTAHPLMPKVAPTTVTPPVPLAAPIAPSTNDEAIAMIDSMSLKATLTMYKHLHSIFNYERVGS